MKIGRRWISLLGLIGILLSGVFAAEDQVGSQTLKQWEESVGKYLETRKELVTAQVKFLDAEIRKAEIANDTALVDELRVERENFVTRGWLPTFVNPATFEKKLVAAQSSLAKTAQRTTIALKRASLIEEAANVDKQLDILTTKPVCEDRTPVRIVPWRDHRVAWVTRSSNAFQLLKSGEWSESVRDGNNSRHFWKEMSRTPKEIELFDAARNFAMKLMDTEAHVDYAVNEKTGPIYGKWNDGRWIDPIKEKILIPGE